MGKKIDLDRWNRKEHFEFFNSFDEPFLGIVTEVDCSLAWEKVQSENIPFFIYYLYQSLKAVNQTEAFSYREKEGEVICYDRIHASPTILREDTTFGFAFMEYNENFDIFSKHAQQEMDAVKKSGGLRLNDQNSRPDVIHYSSIPWFSFTALSHPRNFQNNDSVPKISFGKFREENNRKMLPISVHAHHGLMDGYHVGMFLQAFQNLLNQP